MAAQNVRGNALQLLPEERHVGLSGIHTLQHRDRRLPLCGWNNEAPFNTLTNHAATSYRNNKHGEMTK